MVEVTEEKEKWEVVPKDKKYTDVYDMLEEAFASLGWAYVHDSRDMELVVYVYDVDEEKKKIYVHYGFDTPSTKLVWNGYGSPCVEIAWYSADGMWDIEQTYVDYEKGVWYGEDGKPYPIEEFISEVASDYAAQEWPRIEEGAREIAEEILRYEHGEDEDEEEEE